MQSPRFLRYAGAIFGVSWPPGNQVTGQPSAASDIDGIMPSARINCRVNELPKMGMLSACPIAVLELRHGSRTALTPICNFFGIDCILQPEEALTSGASWA